MNIVEIVANAPSFIKFILSLWERNREHRLHNSADWQYFIRTDRRCVIFVLGIFAFSNIVFFQNFETDALGRRRAMLLVNIPFIICWFTMYQATSVTEVFIAYACLGFSVGLTEAPIITYIGEICEPSLRGLMIAYSSFSVTLGILFVFTLNTFMPWRVVALVCMFVPITTMIGLCLVSDSTTFRALIEKLNKIE